MSPWRRQGGPENSLASTTLSLICLMSDHHQWVVQVLGSLALWSCPPPPPLFPARATLPIIHPPNLAFTHCVLNTTSVLCCLCPSVPCRPPGWQLSCVPRFGVSATPSLWRTHSPDQSHLPHQPSTLLPASVRPRVANTQKCVD